MPQKNKNNKMYQYPSFAVHMYKFEGGEDRSRSDNKGDRWFKESEKSLNSLLD